MKKENEKLFINLAIIAVAYFGIIKPILNKTGITTSATERGEESEIKKIETAPPESNPFDPKYYKSAAARRAGALLLYSAKATELSRIIYNAMGYFSDDESAVYSVFRSLQTKSQVSFLSEKFRQLYNIDMLEFLKRGKNQYNPASGLNTSEIATVINIVNNLPKYRV